MSCWAQNVHVQCFENRPSEWWSAFFEWRSGLEDCQNSRKASV